MTPSASGTQKSKIPVLPIWVMMPVSFAVAFYLGESYGFVWWQRALGVGIVAFVLEAANQAVRRVARRSGKADHLL
ncbi:hypothetical protein [Streptomyces sp. XH2]|uniref:hypothetical protein n=1 Tax=Streptomyces sp. XH2 TaxID=3412483 RepID=UPI003C7A529A